MRQDLIEELEGADEADIQNILEEAWREAKNEAFDIDRALLFYRSADMELDDVINLLDDDLDEDEHK